MNQHRAQEDCTFDRMHRHPRPRTDIDVSVMHAVDMGIDAAPMQKPVCHIEVRAVGKGDQHEQQNEPKFTLIPAIVGDHPLQQ